MSAFRYLELFAGAGGLSLGLDRAGWSCALHAEIHPDGRAVLAHHWPDVPLAGDVAQVRGDAWGDVLLVSGGSPCQDLSVAGKRAGLAGARSGLFHQQVRVWEESGAPYVLWENVLGALSSNRGADFAAVLSAFVGGPVPVPADGWGSAGVVAGPCGVAAWRCLDAQWFGVPQRRRRVFVLGARAGGVDPATVLLEPEGVRRDPPTRGEAREGATRGPASRVADASGFDVAGTLESRTRAGGFPGTDGACAGHVLAFHPTQEPITSAKCRTALGTTTGGMGVLAFAHDATPSVDVELSPMIDAAGCRRVSDAHPSPSVVTITGDDVAHALTHGGSDASEDGTGRGTPIVADFIAEVCDTLDAAFGDTQGLENQHINSGAPRFPVQAGIPRRLMPLECERLMGWPDDWTLVVGPTGKPLSDAARYRLCGNGVVSRCSEWIGWRLRTIHAAMVAAQTEAAA